MSDEATAKVIQIFDGDEDEVPEIVESQLPVKAGRWVPKRWKPVYEEIVALNVMGLDNKSLAERYNYTPQQISNILNTPQADVIRKLAIDRLRKNTLATVEQRLDGLKLKVVEKLEILMTDPKYFEATPFAVVDRGMRIIEKLGTQTPVENPNNGPSGGGGMVVNGNVYVMPNESVDKMTKALDKVNEIKRIHGGREDDNDQRDVSNR